MNGPKKRRKKRENAIPKQFVKTSPEEELRFPTFGQAEETPSQPAEHALIEFFATIEHEFRTPLAIIRGYASTLLRRGQQTLSQDQREALQTIQDAEAHLEVLTNRMLEIAQLEAGHLSPTLHLVDLPPLAHEVIIQAQRHIPDTLQDRFAFTLHLRNHEGHPTSELPPVPGDLLFLRKVLEQLLENAIRFSPEGGRIEIVIRPVPLAAVPSVFPPPLHTHPFLELCVCDDGIGIPEEHLERIFERFYRVDTSLTRTVNGLGLGLTMCRLRVALHQGHIWAERCSAGGSVFHIWLPLGPLPTVE